RREEQTAGELMPHLSDNHARSRSSGGGGVFVGVLVGMVVVAVLRVLAIASPDGVTVRKMLPLPDGDFHLYAIDNVAIGRIRLRAMAARRHNGHGALRNLHAPHP